jgi:hypothetical protein
VIAALTAARACAGVVPVLFTVAAAASAGLSPYLRPVHIAWPVAIATFGSVTVTPGICDELEVDLVGVGCV